MICALYHRFRQRQLPDSRGSWRYSGLPGRLGLVGLLAAEEFEEVGIDFVRHPRVGIAISGE